MMPVDVLEDAARKLTDQVHQLKAENEELKEQHAEEIQEIQKKYELFDEFNRLCSDESTLLDRHMRSKIYNHPSNVSEREYQRDLQLERERKQQLQLEKERERQLQLEREREQQLRLEREREQQLRLEREREQQLQLERERERQLQLERKRQEEQLERAVQNLKIEQQPTRTQTPTRTQNRDDDFDLGCNHHNLTRVGVYPPRRSIKIISLSLITVSSFKRASKICDFWKATAETKLPPLLLDNKNRAIPQGCE